MNKYLSLLKEFYKKYKKYILAFTAILLIIITILILIIGNKKSIIGIWKSVDTDSTYYYIFNKDKTCSYEMKVARLGCTFKYDDEKIIIEYNGSPKEKIFEYRLEKDVLIIKDKSGQEHKFIKENINAIQETRS